jgi:glycosyltransferase involved in cell wall biosynthesis
MLELSVVIPTYNRSKTLDKALAKYSQQASTCSFEVIVVDDGSTDSTMDVVTLAAKRSSLPITYCRQENQGPAAARNLGIRKARGNIILFTDDDIIPGPTLVAEHLTWHRRFADLPTAVLGNVTWAEDAKATPFMEWYGSHSMFLYGHFVRGSELNYTDFYTCNLSLKAEFLRCHGMFDEQFKYSAYEDIELGYRLTKAGMRLLFNADALAWHEQHISFDDACRRARKAQDFEALFKQKEAGLHFSSSQLSKLSPLQRCLSFMSNKGRFLKRHLAWTFSPLKRVMDGNVPLPSSVYRVMLRIYR